MEQATQRCRPTATLLSGPGQAANGVPTNSTPTPALSTPRTHLRAHLLNSIWSFHLPGQGVKVVGPVRQPPDPQPQAAPSMPRRVAKPLPAAPTPSVGPAASKPPPHGTKETAPAPASSSKACTGAADKPKQPSWLRLSPAGGPTPREGQPQQLRMLPHLPRPAANSLLSLGPWRDLTLRPPRCSSRRSHHNPLVQHHPP